MICVPNAEWIAIEAAPRAFDRFTFRANSTSTATTTHAHQRCMKWSRKRSWVSAKPGPCDQSIPSGTKLAVHVRPGVRDIAGAEARDPGAEHQLDEQSAERQRAPAGQPRGPRFWFRASCRRSSAVQISAENRNKANSRCAESR